MVGWTDRNKRNTIYGWLDEYKGNRWMVGWMDGQKIYIYIYEIQTAIPTYIFSWGKLNIDKTTCTLFTPDPAEYKSNLDLKINNTALPMAMHLKVLGHAECSIDNCHRMYTRHKHTSA